MMMSGFDQDVREATIGGRTENPQREPKDTMPKVGRALPKDKSKDRQVEREPDPDYLKKCSHLVEPQGYEGTGEAHN
jgi:hypothetical protein